MDRVYREIERHETKITGIQSSIENRLRRKNRATVGLVLGYGIGAGILALGTGSGYSFFPLGFALPRLVLNKKYQKAIEQQSELINKPTLVEIINGNLSIGLEQTIIEPSDDGKSIAITPDLTHHEKISLVYDTSVFPLQQNLARSLELMESYYDKLQWNQKYIKGEIVDISESIKNYPGKSFRENLKMRLNLWFTRLMSYDEFLNEGLEVTEAAISQQQVVATALKVGGELVRGYEPQAGLEETISLHHELERLYDNIRETVKTSYPLMREKTKLLLAPLNSS